MRGVIFLLVTGLLIEGTLLGLLTIEDLQKDIYRFWIWGFLAFVFYAGAVLFEQRQVGGRYAFPLIVGFAILFRLTFFFSEPSLSGDIYRYLWDGKIQSYGINPYRYAPDAPDLAPLRDTIYERVNHKEVPTIYPPLAQMVFAVTCRLRPTVGGMKAVMIGIDVIIIYLLTPLLRRMRQPVSSVIVYAWNPLVIIETAGSGHSDGIGILFLLLALLWLMRKQESLSAVALGCSCLAKFFGGALVPVFASQIAERKARLRYVLLFAGTVLLGYLPYIGAGERLFTGLGAYASVWESNDLLFSWLARAIGERDAAKAIVGILFAGLIGWMTYRRINPFKATYLAVGAFLLLSPTLHPWYLLWIVPFLCIFRNRAWILFSGLVLLSYQVLIGYTTTGVWTLAPWVLWAEYLPLYGGLTWEMARSHVITAKG